MYKHIYTQHTYKHTFIYIYISCVIRISIYIHTYIHICMFICINMYACMCMCIYIYTYNLRARKRKSQQGKRGHTCQSLSLGVFRDLAVNRVHRSCRWRVFICMYVAYRYARMHVYILCMYALARLHAPERAIPPPSKKWNHLLLSPA
jgi:hypothetical protein